MTFTSGDPAVRAALERQLALLLPVVDGLREAAIEPSPLIADDWRGPAADAAAEFLHDLRAGLREASEAIHDQARVLRVEIAGMS